MVQATTFKLLFASQMLRPMSLGYHAMLLAQLQQPRNQPFFAVNNDITVIIVPRTAASYRSKSMPWENIEFLEIWAMNKKFKRQICRLAFTLKISTATLSLGRGFLHWFVLVRG